MLRPSSSVPNTETFRLTSRPLTAPFPQPPVYLAVPTSSTASPPIFTTHKQLPLTAVPPTQPFDSRDRFLDNATHINAVPRDKVKTSSPTVHFDDLHQLYHDLLLGFYHDTTSNGNDIEHQRQRHRERRHERRKNPRIAFLLKNLLPLISQGLHELGHVISYRQKSFEKILPQSTKSPALVHPPGGAVNWLARYMVRNNPKHDQEEYDSASMASSRVHRQYDAVLTQCLKEFDAWQLCIEHREALENVNLHAIWKSIDTNDDGTLDVSEVGTALEALGFQLIGKPKNSISNPPTTNTMNASSMLAFVVGDRVRARFAGKGHFYPADVTALNDDGTYKLLYLDGDWEDDAKEENLEWIASTSKVKTKQHQPPPPPPPPQKEKEEPTTTVKHALSIELNEMQKLFAALDVDGSGDIDFDEFVLGTTRWFLGREALTKAIFDRNLSTHHEIDTDDMSMLLQSLARKRMVRALQAAHLDSGKLFCKLDCDNDGHVDLEEFVAGVSELAMAMHEESQQNQIVMILNRNALQLFETIDLNGDGLISLEEFQTFVVKYLDEHIEQRARKAAQRICDEQEGMITLLSERGTSSLNAADKDLAAEKVRLDQCRLKQLALLRSAVERFRIDLKVENDASGPEQNLLKEALMILSDCVKTASTADKIISASLSDLVEAHNALSAAKKQKSSATILADLKSIVNYNNNDSTLVDLVVLSLNVVRSAVDETLAVVSNEGMPLLELLNQANKRRQENKKKNKQQRELELVMDKKRKQEAADTHERRRRRAVLEAAEKDANDKKKQEKERNQQKLQEKAETERRRIRQEMRRASIVRDEEFKAAIRAEKDAEKEAEKQALERIENWNPEQSVFSHRGVGVTAGFFDTDELCQKALALEIERAVSKPGIIKLINHPIDHQVEDVRKALLNDGRTARILIDIFRHYCLLGFSIFNVQKHGFDTFALESGIVAPNCNSHSLETIFIASNMNTSGAKSNEKPDRSLNRAEFIEAIIRIGIKKFYSADRTNRYSVGTTGEAVMRLILEHLLPLIENKAKSGIRFVRDSNELRTNVLYSIQIDNVFRKNKNIITLKDIFEINCSHGTRMSYSEWMRFVKKQQDKSSPEQKEGKALTVPGSFKFSESKAKECFLLSRLMVIDEQGSHERKCQQLSFEDFLESLVRLTELMKPTEDNEHSSNDPNEVAARLDLLVASIIDGGVSRYNRKNRRFDAQ